MIATARVAGPKNSSRWGNWFGTFALRCNVCGRFTIGCSEHRLCGLCEPGRASLEDDERYDDLDTPQQQG